MNGESAMNDNQTAWQEYDKLGHEIDMLENKRGDLLGSLIPRLKDIAYHLGFQFDRIIGLRDSTISGALTMTCLIYGCRGGSDEESEHTFPGVYLFMTAEEFDKKVAQDNKVKSSNLKNAKLREIEAIEERLTKAKKELERIG
jgi:hypothetical protein